MVLLPLLMLNAWLGSVLLSAGASGFPGNLLAELQAMAADPHKAKEPAAASSLGTTTPDVSSANSRHPELGSTMGTSCAHDGAALHLLTLILSVAVVSNHRWHDVI